MNLSLEVNALISFRLREQMAAALPFLGHRWHSLQCPSLKALRLLKKLVINLKIHVKGFLSFHEVWGSHCT